MNRSHPTLRGVTSISVLVGLIISAACIFGTHRARASDAVQFSPGADKSVRIAAGAVIDAELRSPIPASSQVGDTVTAFVSRSVTLDGELMIPVGARLKGAIQSINVAAGWANTEIGFTQLSFNHDSFAMDSSQAFVRVPVQSDIEILRDAWRTLMSTGFGAAMGASSGDVRLIDRNLRRGVIASATPQIRIPVQVILREDLEIR